MRKTKLIGTSIESVKNAEVKLGVTFPEELVQIWIISNGLELPEGWQLFPVFDLTNPRKTSNDIVYENTKGRWPTMDNNLISIAAGDTGNQLVLQRVDNIINNTVLLWDHENRETTPWDKELKDILEIAKERAANIFELQNKYNQ